MSLKLSDSMHSPKAGKDTNNQSQKPSIRFKPYSPAPKPLTLKPQKEIVPNHKSVIVQEVKEKDSAVKQQPTKITSAPKKWISTALWAVSGAMFLALIAVVLSFVGVFGKNEAVPKATQETTAGNNSAALPIYSPLDNSPLKRDALPVTTIPERTSLAATTYIVEPLESIFSIATKFDLKPESVLWANMEELQDDPQMVEVGSTLNIPSVDGVYYKWKEGDTLEGVAGRYYAEVNDIVEWPGNNFDLADPQIEPGTYVMIPGGIGQFRSWTVPIGYISNAGVAKSINNQCAISPGYSWGTGGFIYPTANYAVSGNDFWEGHLGVDYAGYLGDAVFASDSGVVVFAGSMSGGYGNVIILQHDTTYHVYHTVYAHLSGINVSCGQSVYQGQVIGAVGSSGNSTGPHLHFEIRMDGSFLNPHLVVN